MLMRYEIGSQVLLPGQCNLLERNTTHAFREWWSKMLISSTCIPHVGDYKRKRSDLLVMNVSKDEGKLTSKPKLKIVCSGKPLDSFIPPIEDSSSHVKILGIDVVIPATPILAIPIQSIAPLPQNELSIGVCEPSIEKIIELPPKGAENIMYILDAESNPAECMGESDDVNFKEELAHVPLPSGSQCFPLVESRGVCFPNDDEVESIRKVHAPSLVPHPQHPLRAPQGGISIFNADAIIKEVDKNAARVFGKVILDKVYRTLFDGLPSLKAFMPLSFKEAVDVTPLGTKVEGLIKQAHEFKDLQQSYSC
ncbi:hypothetical protein Cgig2_008354 [Carnegiea gigantea]|uniref:Uncharacterized protein n=1 Tax=Carnegiea gigantea TaxID=171969 RepID=A0A9Q1KBQ7_9CARY|nr:hypothetical protein Cgig2_008354 [Carnegiea gigantea]